MIGRQDREQAEAFRRLEKALGKEEAGLVWSIGLRMARTQKARTVREFMLRVYVPAVERALSGGRLKELLSKWERVPVESLEKKYANEMVVV